MTAPPFIIPPEPEHPTIAIRDAEPAVAIVLTPSRPSVSIGGAQLEPGDAHALGMAIEHALGLHAQREDATIPAVAFQETPGGAVVACVIDEDDALALFLTTDTVRRHIWTGPENGLADGLDLGVALLIAAKGALAILHYGDMQYLSPFAPRMPEVPS